MSYRLIDVVQRLGRPRVLVLGDPILDRYVTGDAERISQEAPVILLREQGREDRLGGAANVANMLAGLEAEVAIAAVVGDDSDGRRVRELLTAAGADCGALIDDASRPTTVKQRFVGRAQHRHQHQMLRVDREVRSPLDGGTTRRLLERTLRQLESADTVLISDYAKGVCTPAVLAAVIEAAQSAGVAVIVDPASSRDYRGYRGATAITPNRLETSQATNREIQTADDAFSAGRKLCAELELEFACITLDAEGIAVVQANGAAELAPTRRRQVYDITGAGDMVLATIGIGLAAGVAPLELARLANVAGGLEVGKPGVAIVTREEVLADLMSGGRTVQEKVGELDELVRQVDARRRLHQRTVLTNGCFDLLHPGHVQFLQEAATHGDSLIVAVNSDASVRKHKGFDRPVIGENDRAAMLAALECVDHVIIFDEDTPLALLEQLKPDMLIKGGTTPEVVGRELVENYGGQVLTLGAVARFSTTSIVTRIREAA